MSCGFDHARVVDAVGWLIMQPTDTSVMTERSHDESADGRARRGLSVLSAMILIDWRPTSNGAKSKRYWREVAGGFCWDRRFTEKNTQNLC
jgi:hypothetical protein